DLATALAGQGRGGCRWLGGGRWSSGGRRGAGTRCRARRGRSASGGRGGRRGNRWGRWRGRLAGPGWRGRPWRLGWLGRRGGRAGRRGRAGCEQAAPREDAQLQEPLAAGESAPRLGGPLTGCTGYWHRGVLLRPGTVRERAAEPRHREKQARAAGR